MTCFETWKGIAQAMNRSERWCRTMARLTDDPLPGFKVGGIVRLDVADLEGWIARRRQVRLGAGVAPLGLALVA